MKEQNEKDNSNTQSYIITKTLTNGTSDFFQDDHLFKLMIESAEEYAIFVVDGDGHIINWNAGAERIFGYQEHEIVGENFAVLFSAEDVAAGIPQEEMSKARKTGAAPDDRWLRKADESRFWASGKLMALKDEAGDFKGFVKIIRDQTDHKLHARDLTSADLRFQEMIRQSPLSTFVQDPTGHVTYVNPAFTKLWNVTLEDLTNYNALQDEQADALGIKPYIERAFAGEAVEIPPIFYDPKNTASVGEGNPCWVKTFAYPIKDAQGNIVEVVTTHEDVSEKIKAEAELLDSKQRLTLAQEVGKAGSFEWHIAKDENIWSPELERLFDIEPGTFERNLEGWEKRVVKTDAEQVLSGFRKAFESKQSNIEAEFRAILPDGSLRWLQSRTRIEYDADGQPLRAIGICLDITDRKQAEEELRVSRERYEALIKASAQIVWTTDTSGAVVEDSPDWRNFTGLSYDEWKGQGWLNVVHQEDRSRAARAWKKAVAEQSFYESEYRIKTTDGEYRWTAARGVPVKNKDGIIREWVGMNTDIHEQKLAEEAIRQSEEKYRTLFETIDEGFCLIKVLYDENGRPADYRFLEVNRVFEQQTGLENPIGKSVREMVPNIEMRWIETYADVARTGESIRFENSSEAMNRWFDVYASRVGGESDVVAIVFKDVTERKRREQQLAFLAEFSQALITLPKISDIIEVFGNGLSRFLDVSVCAFIEINEKKDAAFINYEWRKSDKFSLLGRYDLPEFVTCEFLETMASGHPVIVTDIAVDSRVEDKSEFDALSIGSFVNVPLISGGEWKFVLGVYREQPYEWQADEIALLLEAVNRIWTKIERVRAEEALQESHARREFVLESSRIGEWELNLATGKAQHTFIHDQCFGAVEPLENWNYEVFLDYVHPNDRLQVKRTFDESINEQKKWDFECRVVWADKSVHWIHAQGNFYTAPTEEEKPPRMVGIVTDITEQKQAEEDLRASEEFNRSVIASSPDCFKILDIEGRLQFMNDDGFCLMEIDDFEQFKGQIWVDFWQNEEHALAVEAAEAAKRGEIGKFQGFCRTAKGTPKWWDVVVAPVRGARGEVVRLLSISRDITENKRAEQEREDLRQREINALKQSEIERQKLESLFKQAPAIINITRGEDHVFELVHPMMNELVGVRELLGKTVSEALPEISKQGFLELLDNVYKTGKPYFGKENFVILQTMDGTPRDGYFDFIYQPWYEVSGEIAGVMSFAVEVTERVLARQQMEKAAAEREQMLEREQNLRQTAEEASRMKDEFLATVSHELRTPLNAILGWSQMMRSGVVKADQYEKAIETIDRNARSQGQLIDDLLDITRIITGKLRLNIDEVNFTSVINSALQTVRPAAQAKSIHLSVNAPIEQTDILGDGERLQQIVWNLLSNAVKFTPKGGEIFVNLEMKGSHLKLTVRDTGEGIEPEFLPLVFDRFSQADMSSTRRMGGLGLGLSIVRHLVEMHGGTINVSSAGKGAGTTFTLMLPMIIEKDEAVPIAARGNNYPDNAVTAPTVRLDGVKILVVDDEPDACDVLEILLEQCGAHVSTANSAAEALIAVSTESFDVIISDIAMPVEDGYTLIQKIRLLPEEKGRTIPAIALTAYAGQADRKKALAAGFQSHVTKPVDQHALVTILASLV